MFGFYLTPHPIAGTNSRLDLVAAIVRDGTITIDNYHGNTSDKAYFKGHYYCDKAPGSPILIVPAAYIFNIFRPVDPNDVWFRYFATLVASAIPAAALALMLLVMAARAAGSTSAGFAMAAAALFGTILFPYATIVHGHALSAALSFAIFFIAVRREEISAPGMLACGFFAPWMVISEYPTVVHAVALTAFIAYRARPKFRLLFLLPGFISVAALFLAYNYAAYGRLLDLGYFHEAYPLYATANTTGFGGVTLPTIRGFYELLLRPGHGILAASPFMIFAAPGFIAGLKSGKYRGAVVAAAIVCAGMLVLYSAYFLHLSRFMISIVPYLAFMSAFALKEAGAARRGVFYGLAFVSVLTFAAVAASGEPTVRHEVSMPLLDFNLELIKGRVLRPSWPGGLIGHAVFSLWVWAGGAIAIAVLALKYTIADKKPQTVKVLVWSVLSVIVMAGINFGAWRTQAGTSDPAANVFLGDTFMKYGRRESAEREYMVALEKAPDASNAHELYGALGRIAWERGDYAAALERYHKALERRPAYHFAHLNLAAIYKTLGREQESLYHYRLGEKYYKESVEGFTGRGDAPE